jgi:hypothetical protein
LTNDTLLFLDKTNKHIFLCDKNGKVSHKINLIHEPEDIAIIDDERAGVTPWHSNNQCEKFEKRPGP